MKVSMKFGSLTSANAPGGSGNGGAKTPSGSSSGSASNLESTTSFISMDDPSKIYLYVKKHAGRFINEVSVVSVDGELPPSHDDKNTFYFIQDVENQEGA